MTLFGYEIAIWQFATLALSAVLIGINKTGMPGIGVLPVVILAQSFQINLSTGLQLIMLCCGDLIAISYYRRRANWQVLSRVLPCALPGLALGWGVMKYFDDNTLSLAIALIIIALGVLNILRKYCFLNYQVSAHWLIGLLFGTMAGFTTQIANAAGPVMAIYLLALALPKDEYMGTNVWFFMVVNFIKLPIFLSQGRINTEALLLDLTVLPFLVLGAFLGIVFIRKAPQKIFELVIEILIFISAFRMLYMALT